MELLLAIVGMLMALTWVIELMYSLILLAFRSQVRLGWVGRRLGFWGLMLLQLALLIVFWVAGADVENPATAVALAGFFLIATDNLLNGKKQALYD